MTSVPVRAWRADPRIAAAAAILAGIVAAGVVVWLAGSWTIAAGFLAAALLLAAGVFLLRGIVTRRDAAQDVAPDWTVALTLAQANADAIAVTGRDGQLVCANDRYEALFGGYPTPPGTGFDAGVTATLADAGRAAWRDGQASATGVDHATRRLDVHVVRTGRAQDMLFWRFVAQEAEAGPSVEAALGGGMGSALSEAGIMAALVDPAARVIAANAAFLTATGSAPGASLVDLLSNDGAGHVRLARDGGVAAPLRLVETAIGAGDDAPLLTLLLDDAEPPVPPAEARDLATVLALMPFGLALVDREGRFRDMNPAFVRALGVDPAALPLYPGDLVVREDKGAIADAVRRVSTGGSIPSSEVAVRLKDHPEELISLSLANVRGLGGASVMLSLRESGEESRLKREVAQATKMQAVGQLAGGVAHDFNNILTAIIGHCDLILMRHSPGDSDYDDIQQIRTNSNRAAGLTRQLLAFSRQQTLRPQVLQLPDVVSEVSNLLRRLLGESVMLEVKHGRDLGAVRADPGQLEQVVVNLAVNARDAILTRNPTRGGRLTIQTRTASIAEIRHRGTDIMPLGDYTALEIADNGTGIPPDVLPKIFEPFFTTKEVGKGTGLGLSTVYGIVKQSGGFIFADSRPGQGATFTIYLPVHTASTPAVVPITSKARASDTWGTGTILLVEDEAMVRSVAERALARQGYTVLAAENGEEAMELLKDVDPPSLIVSDVMMPVMDGPTLARAVRRRHPSIPILFMSGYAEEQLRRSIDLDNVAFLPKPFSVQQLAEAARDALSEQADR